MSTEQQPKISDSDIVTQFHYSSLEASKAFQMMHNSLVKSLQENQKLKQENQTLAEKILTLSQGKKDE